MHVNISNHGYLYFVYDQNRLNHSELEKTIQEIGLHHL
ncbi:hypothetical protein ACIN5035_0920 [Acinetobacter baumannii OIFC035]|nr:hypothetical protein ACIN5035_0920 [Acinetobacter baumannii OIFC035]